MNRTNKKVHQKIELTFKKEIHVKNYSEQKKNHPQNFPNFSRKIDKLDTIFKKSHRSSVILKILENFSNLSKI